MHDMIWWCLVYVVIPRDRHSRLRTEMFPGDPTRRIDIFVVDYILRYVMDNNSTCTMPYYYYYYYYYYMMAVHLHGLIDMLYHYREIGVKPGGLSSSGRQALLRIHKELVAEQKRQPRQANAIDTTQDLRKRKNSPVSIHERVERNSKDLKVIEKRLIQVEKRVAAIEEVVFPPTP